jgi:putative PIN family toxin of toxin-antitoxin system
MLRIVIDTNVLVSSVISKKGAPAQLMDAWSDHVFDIVVSDAIIREVERVLLEPHLKQVFNITEKRITRLVEMLSEDGILVPGTADMHGSIPSDPTDEMFLAAAIDGNAEILVSGDKHLLDLGFYSGVVIITPRQLLDRLKSGK